MSIQGSMTAALIDASLRRRPGKTTKEDAGGSSSGATEVVNKTSSPGTPSRVRPAEANTSRRLALALVIGFVLGLTLPRLTRPHSNLEYAGDGDDDADQDDDDDDDEVNLDAGGYARYNDPSDRHYGGEDLFVRIVDENQPILQYMDDAMPADEFMALQDCLRDHPMRHSNVNNEETFGLTKGFVVSFNEEGLHKVANHSSFSCLLPYFERHRHPASNAWILNMVWAEVPNYKEEFAIKLHTDDALEMSYPGDRKMMPYQTSVLYAFLPDDMQGGEIEAFPYTSTDEEMKGAAKYQVKPKVNRMAYFRGDSWHRVRSYTTKSKNVLRAGLVLESYAVPINLRKYVVPFHWYDRDSDEMM